MLKVLRVQKSSGVIEVKWNAQGNALLMEDSEGKLYELSVEAFKAKFKRLLKEYKGEPPFGVWPSCTVQYCAWEDALKGWEPTSEGIKEAK